MRLWSLRNQFCGSEWPHRGQEGRGWAARSQQELLPHEGVAGLTLVQSRRASSVWGWRPRAAISFSDHALP